MITWPGCPGSINRLLSVSCRLPDQAEATYARVWRDKAAVARVLQHRQAALTLRAGADAATRQTLESWRDVRRQLARLLLATADGRDDPGRVQRLRSLTAEKERLERELAEAIPEFAREQALMRSPHTRLMELLPAGTVVLDLVAFNRFEQDPQVRGKKGDRLTPSYVGFVLARGQPVRQVDLGPAQPIDEAVQRLAGGHHAPANEPGRRGRPPDGLGAAGAALPARDDDRAHRPRWTARPQSPGRPCPATGRARCCWSNTPWPPSPTRRSSSTA